jgi:hypothetical protein
MPRRTVEKANKVAAQRAAARIRCLVRNRDFRRDLMAVRRQLPRDHRMESYFAFLAKWDLQWFPSRLLTSGDQLPATPQGYETVIFQQMREYLHSQHPDNRFIVLPAVVAKDPFEEYVEAHSDPENNSPVPEHIPRRGKVLNVRIDLSYPQDLLEALVKDELKKAKENRNRLQREGLLQTASDPERLHVEKIPFYMEVFDRHSAGEPYRTITTDLRSRKSTVQYAHVVAMRLIGGSPPPQRQTDFRAAADVRNPDGWIRPHLQQCQVCTAANHWNDHCDGFKSFVTSNFGLDFVRFEEMSSDNPDTEPQEN